MFPINLEKLYPTKSTNNETAKLITANTQVFLIIKIIIIYNPGHNSYHKTLLRLRSGNLYREVNIQSA